ncbi:FecR family protein [Telluria beijingensis]|uniref:FecR family protein n=1 Tax=Telluria beijingensis TaxID=3068633 RepID=UPI00279585A2|nr:FecR domain-containing protein [Massilia sp. REN29]
MGEILPFSGAPTPEQEAQRWIVRIDRGPLDPGERGALQAWLAQDPLHGRLLDEHARLWHAAGKARAVANDAAAPQPAPARRRRWPGVAAVAASLAALAIWFGMPGDGHRNLTLQTAAGQHQRVTLDDGSHIDLNTRTRAEVNYQPRRRQVVLVEGEGYFDVAKDGSRPFTVVAGATTVRAVGTRFSVRRQADGRVDVVVHEGVVEVSRAGAAPQAGKAPARLEAGQALAATAAGLETRTLAPERLPQLLAWQQGRVNFDNAALPAVLAEMSRYSEQPILPGDAGLASIRISGSFSTRETQAFLRTLEQAFALKVERRGDRYLVVARIGATRQDAAGSGGPRR